LYICLGAETGDAPHLSFTAFSEQDGRARIYQIMIMMVNGLYRSAFWMSAVTFITRLSGPYGVCVILRYCDRELSQCGTLQIKDVEDWGARML
jgi:hypothetical protein